VWYLSSAIALGVLSLIPALNIQSFHPCRTVRGGRVGVGRTKDHLRQRSSYSDAFRLSATRFLFNAARAIDSLEVRLFLNLDRFEEHLGHVASAAFVVTDRQGSSSDKQIGESGQPALAASKRQIMDGLRRKLLDKQAAVDEHR
jgi:hypothetical protein